MGRKKLTKFIGVFDATDPIFQAEVRDSVTGESLGSFTSIQDAKDAVEVFLMDSKYCTYRQTPIRVQSTWPAYINGNEEVINNIETESKYSVAQRVEFMKNLVKMVADNQIAGAVICGPPGIGKTTLCQEVFNEKRYSEGDQYIINKGRISPLGLYRLLYLNQDRLIVFDDADDALTNPSAANLLKAALDTTTRREISWHSNVLAKQDDIEESFVFNGRIIFLSNINQEKIEPSIVSRAMCLDLKFSRKDIMDRIIQLSSKICTYLTEYEQLEVLEFLEENMNKLKDFNLRTLIKVAKVRRTNGVNWKQMSEYLFI